MTRTHGRFTSHKGSKKCGERGGADPNCKKDPAKCSKHAPSAENMRDRQIDWDTYLAMNESGST